MEIEDIKSSIIVTLANNGVECEDYLDFTATTDTITSRKDQESIMTPDTISSHIEEVASNAISYQIMRNTNKLEYKGNKLVISSERFCFSV